MRHHCLPQSLYVQLYLVIISQSGRVLAHQTVIPVIIVKLSLALFLAENWLAYRLLCKWCELSRFSDVQEPPFTKWMLSILSLSGGSCEKGIHRLSE